LNEQQSPEAVTLPDLVDFFVNTPPGKELHISINYREPHWDAQAQAHMGKVAVSDLTLHCGSPACGSDRQFAPTHATLGVELKTQTETRQDRFFVFVCRNCRLFSKTYAVEIRMTKDDEAVVFKYGEDPPFGPPLPSRLLKLAEDQRDLLLKGRRCENQGLGIAAFAYYRRVVEEQKNRILDEILRVSRTLGAPEELLSELEAAKQERRFTQAIDGIKHGLPQALLTNGHNPLALLHNALSEGLHGGSDDECLELATSIRYVLSDLVERLSHALKNDADLNKAVSKLLQVRQK
jgi:hypothetical protein